MKSGGDDDDIAQIEAMNRRQFGSLYWTPERGADWSGFAHDFSAVAVLYPATRPARSQSVDAFMARMKNLSQTTLRSFRERMLGAQIRTFGNVAVAADGRLTRGATGAATENRDRRRHCAQAATIRIALTCGPRQLVEEGGPASDGPLRPDLNRRNP